MDKDFVVKNEPHEGNCWEMFTVTFVFVPGSRPQMFATPLLAKDRLDQKGRSPGEGELEFTITQLTAGMTELAKDMLKSIPSTWLGPVDTWPSTKHREEQARLAKVKIFDRDELFDMLVRHQPHPLIGHGDYNYRNARILASLLRLNPREERVAFLANMKDANLRAEVLGLLKANNVEVE